MRRFLFLLALLLFVIPSARYLNDDPAMPLVKPYEDLTEPSFLLYDFLTQPIGDFAPLIISIVSLILSGFLLWRILRTHEWKVELAAFAVVLFATSPMVLWASSGQGSFSLSILLALSVWWMVRENFVGAILAVSLLSWQGFWESVLALCIVFITTRYWVLSQLKRWILKMIPLAFAIVYFFTQSRIYDTVSFVEFGDLAGFSIFGVALMIIGVVSVWKSKKKFYQLYLLSFFILLGSIWIPSLRIADALLFPVLGAQAIDSLLKRRWHVPLLKYFTILIIACGILFAWITCFFLLVESQPLAGTADVLSALDSRPEGTVLIPEEYGPWVSYWAHKPIVHNPDAMLFGTDLLKTRQSLKKNDVKYVVILPEMIGSVWKRSDDGLLFLINNNETFKNVIRGRVWEVKHA